MSFEIRDLNNNKYRNVDDFLNKQGYISKQKVKEAIEKEKMKGIKISESSDDRVRILGVGIVDNCNALISILDLKE